MRRYSPPLPKINLYEDGFKQHDLLERSELGRQLSNLVEKFDEPLVLAIDGAWGDGKSFFLKCWCGAHTTENDGTALVIYFDAFESDFVGDPIVALTSALEERFPKDIEGKPALRRLRDAAAILWRPVSRIGLAVASSGTSEIVGTLGDAAVAQIQKEAENVTNQTWEEAKSRSSAITHFRQALSELTDDGGNKRNILFVVDELDRCRPDYAIELLEVIKHFFSVPNVHFILGVNLREINSAIQHRYGLSTDTARYLQKHISFTLSMPQKSGRREQHREVSLSYFSQMWPKMGLDRDLGNFLGESLKPALTANKVSLRDIDRILSTAALLTFGSNSPFKQYYLGYKHAICGSVLLRVLKPEIFNGLMNGDNLFREVMAFFGLHEKPHEFTGRRLAVVWQSWSGFLDPKEAIDGMSFGDLFDFSEPPEQEALQSLLTDKFLTFEALEAP
ncbi:hypothetical protein HKCCE3408_12415 [Rhodobacterales bacterium HKCCE3408]|nr:hypothetical protein [Rhodobacterales bacterium HKCCE3408]